MAWVMVTSGGEKNTYSEVLNDYWYYRWCCIGTIGPPNLTVKATTKSCVKMTYRYYRVSIGTTGLHRYYRWNSVTTDSSLLRNFVQPCARSRADRYYRCTQKTLYIFSKCVWVQCVSQAHKYNRQEHF
jgi:hypothetical protein